MHEMQLIATDASCSVVCGSCLSVCVGVLGTRVICAKTDEHIEMPFGD